ncbi:MAG: phosphoglucosamine mutase [Candidatus Cloacimonetes bacterium]|nr:phosphoglucosamine mutase [Candidatus Cloacimonadota bacterium]
MPKLMKSVSGIRGIVGETLTVNNVINFAQKFSTYCKKGKILVGRDSRITGQMLFNAISSRLMSIGSDVVDLGICPTPTILLAVEKSEASGGIAITASHNPKEWNALKLIGPNGTFLTEKQSKMFWSINSEDIINQKWDRIGKLSLDNSAIENHIKGILNLKYVDIQAIRKNHFKVVIDSTNGAGGLLSPQLLRELGCEVIELFSEPTGIFSRIAEPSANNLHELEKLVLSEKADIGFATDPDVDRLSVVSEKGKALGTELSLLLAEEYILSQKRGNIATNLSSSMASEDIAKKYNVKIFRSKVGEINVVETMKKNNCVIGGEGNGGIILPELHYTRDAPLGMALILSYMAKTGKRISELFNLIPHYFMCKTKIQLTDNIDFDERLIHIKNKFPDCEFDFTDGIKIVNKDYWVHIRKSGTEPVVRIISESESIEKSEKLINSIKILLKSIT